CAGTIQDTDGDGVCDANDNCPNVTGQIGSSCDDGNANTTNDVLNASCQCVGTPVAVNCPGDINGDHLVNITDFGFFVGVFNTTCSGCAADMNNDGAVNVSDFGPFVSVFGQPCN